MAEKNYFVHESSYVDEGCEIGEGTKIWHFSHIMKGCKIGKKCNIGQNVVISPDVVLGEGVKIQNNVSVYTGVICEDGVFRKKEYRRTVIKKGASLGANCTIVCGHDVGRYALVGAGSVVTKDVPDYAMVYGTPARVMGHVCQCGVKLHFTDGQAVCPACGKKYKMNEKSEVEEID